MVRVRRCGANCGQQKIANKRSKKKKTKIDVRRTSLIFHVECQKSKFENHHQHHHFLLPKIIHDPLHLTIMYLSCYHISSLSIGILALFWNTTLFTYVWNHYLAPHAREFAFAASPPLIWLASINATTFFLFGLDKICSKIGGPRIPESVLLLFSMGGGFVGQHLGQRLFHHKSNVQRKRSFQIVKYLSLCLWVYLLFFSWR